MRDLPNLDFLRACAVLTVVLEHTLLAYNVQLIGSWRVSWIGVVGVFVFFVHTALVLMWSLERKPHTLDFYIRRIFRIYPLAIAAIAVAVVFHAPTSGTPTHFFQFVHWTNPLQIPASMLLLPNIIGPTFQPVGVMWSLPYEVQMYLGLPLMFFFVRRNFSLWPLLVFWAFIMGLNARTFPGVAHNFYLCIPYFLPGVIAYVGFGRYKPKLPWQAFPCFLILLWSGFMLAPSWRRADLLCLALGLGLPAFHQIKNATLARVSHEIAKYSYGIYLSHPFAIVLGIYLLPHQPRALQVAVIVLGTAVFSVAGYHLLERPMIRLGSRLANRASTRYEQQLLSEFRIPEAEVS